MTAGAPRAMARYGRYDVLFRIASGGMAEVFAARITGEGGFAKLVALKRMLPNLGEDERFEAMFLDEGRVAANIASPHVVQTLDLGRADDGSLYLVMELVVGASLATIVKSMGRRAGGLAIPLAAEIVAQAAEGLHDAHEARTIYGEPLRIVHRDVSPANVIVDVSGRARITDFGVARAIERMQHTQTGEVKGKIAYFSPEQARAKVVDRRTDVFALGIVAWELVTGERLFQAENPATTMARVLSGPIPRVDAIRPEVPRAFADAIAAALERDPDRRTPTAEAFARDLRAASPCASASEIAALVRAHGGDTLARLQDGLRSLAPGGEERRTAALEAPDAPLDAPPGVVDAVLRHEAPTAMILAVEPTAEHTAPTTVPPPPRHRGAPLVLALGVGLVLVTGVAIAIALSQRDTTTIVATPLAPVAGAPGSGETVPAAVAETVAVAETAAVTETAAETEAATETETAAVTETETATVAETVAVSDEPERALADPTPARRRARATSRVREPASTGMRSAAPRRGTLRGLDQFERELGD